MVIIFLLQAPHLTQNDPAQLDGSSKDQSSTSTEEPEGKKPSAFLEDDFQDCTDHDHSNEPGEYAFSELALSFLMGTFDRAYANDVSAAVNREQKGLSRPSGKDGAEVPVHAIGQLDMEKNLKEALQKVMQACECTGFSNMGTKRAQNAGFGVRCSCHKAKEPLAIDIGKVKCKGKDIDPKSAKEEYGNIVKCFLEKKDGANVNIIFGRQSQVPGGWIADPSGKHDDHMHFQEPGCGKKVQAEGRCGGKYEKGAEPIDKDGK